jgi:hypothetical protein
LAVILILIAFYFDYKSEKESFFEDLKGGLFVFGIFILNAFILKYLIGLNFLYIIFATGIEIILLFTIKGFFNKK